MHPFFSVVTLFSLLQAVSAVPTSLVQRGISSAQTSQLALYAQYAAAAYCKDNNDDSTGAITCPSGNCPSVSSAGAQSILEFSNLGSADATGFVAVDNANKVIVLSYRGTTSLGNWIGNINIEFASFDVCNGCAVHAGFLDSWIASKDQVTSAIQQALSAHPDYAIVATGHSLGAAITTLAAADLRQQGFNIALYTYGSPMVGNNAFATFVTNQNGGNLRVTHTNDAIPKLPGYALQYRHVSPEYWITAASGKTPGPNDIKTSTGTFDLKGNQGTFISTISDHQWYFNAITACSPGFEI